MTRIRALIALAAAGLVFSLLGCAPAASEDRPLVVVSTNILGDIVSEVVGDQAEVLTLMKPDADPHSFEISAREAARLRGAALVISNGLGLEEGLQRHLDEAGAQGVRRFIAGDAVEVLPYKDGDASGTPDPHFWTDPARMIDVVDALEPILADVPGVDRSRLHEATQAYRSELEALDAQMAAAFARIPAAQRALVTNHHVFGYLADRYGFRVVGTAIPGGTTLAAPSSSDLAGLVGAIEQNGVRTIFAESSSPDRLVRALADEADIDVAVVELFTESLTGPRGAAPDYLTMMRVNTERITHGLSP